MFVSPIDVPGIFNQGPRWEITAKSLERVLWTFVLCQGHGVEGRTQMQNFKQKLDLFQKRKARTKSAAEPDIKKH